MGGGGRVPEPPRRWAPEPREQVLASPTGRHGWATAPHHAILPPRSRWTVLPSQALGLGDRDAVCLGAASCRAEPRETSSRRLHTFKWPLRVLFPRRPDV